ncbi:MAG: hypothetical protein HRU20_15855 [Pseudomonadales bacterium]|nr:hypothetical protein [Pseudomonadales bacterium]
MKTNYWLKCMAVALIITPSLTLASQLTDQLQESLEEAGNKQNAEYVAACLDIDKKLKGATPEAQAKFKAKLSPKGGQYIDRCLIFAEEYRAALMKALNLS